MGQALVGLIGVAIGSLLSAGAAYAMARRTEARRARDADGLLEAELQPAARQLGILRGRLQLAEDLAQWHAEEGSTPSAPSLKRCNAGATWQPLSCACMGSLRMSGLANHAVLAIGLRLGLRSLP